MQVTYILQSIQVLNKNKFTKSLDPNPQILYQEVTTEKLKNLKSLTNFIQIKKYIFTRFSCF